MADAAKSPMSGADILVESLIRQGVDTVFAYPGGASMPLHQALTKVTDLTFRRSLRGRLLGYGTLIVESAGQDQALSHIDYIPRPEEVYEALSELIFGDKKQTRSHNLDRPPIPRRRHRLRPRWNGPE